MKRHGVRRRGALALAAGAALGATLAGVGPGIALAAASSTACPANRSLAHLDATDRAPQCPGRVPGKGGVWAGQKLFPGAQAGALLERTCAFDWRSEIGAPPDLESLNQYLLQMKYSTRPAEPDCPVLAAMSELSDDAAVSKALMAATRAMGTETVALPPAPGGPARVAVIDTAAHPWEPYGRDTYDHGRNVGAVIRQVGCPERGGPCLLQIENHLALPRLAPDKVDLANGGYFGTRSELAAALWSAVGKESSQPLVINLSVGWDSTSENGGAYDKGPSELSLAAGSVHAAITYAACRNALIIASAGNRSGRGRGPTFPAAWETKPAPTADECRAYGASGPAPSASKYRPLLYAVSALDAKDRFLPNTRVGGRARLAAFGASVMAEDPARGHSSPMTGTSMAAAVVSGAAAAVLAYEPKLSPHDAMDLIYRAGWRLKESPEFCFGAGCAAQHSVRVSACNALRALRPDVVCRTLSAYGGSAVSDRAWPSPGEKVEASPLLAPPVLQSKPAPWVGPQPGDDSCDVCRINVKSIVISLKEDAPPYDAAFVGVNGDAGDTAWYSAPPPAGGAKAFSIAGVDAAAATSAVVSFRIAGTDVYETFEPILSVE